MASKTNGLIQKIKPNATTYSIASTAYGVCETPANIDAKIVDMAGFTLLEGTTIHVKFNNENTAANPPTLNVQGTGAKPIVQYEGTAIGTTAETTGWQAGAVVSLTYDGTSWVRNQGYNTNVVFYGICSTTAGTLEKSVTANGFNAENLIPGAIVLVKFEVTESSSSSTSAMALNVNNTGAKPIKFLYNGTYTVLPNRNYLRANQIYQFIYDGENWIIQLMRNTTGNDTYDRTYMNNNKKARVAIEAGSICVGDSTGYAGIDEGVTFDISYPILYMGTAMNKDAQRSDFYIYLPSITSTVNTTGLTHIANGVLYLTGTLSGHIFTCNSKILTYTVPTQEDGLIYIPVGINTNATSQSFYFLGGLAKMFWYKNGAFRPYVNNAATVNGHTVEKDVPSNAIFTDTNKYHKSGSWNGLTYTATAVNDADELKFTIPDSYGDTKNPYGEKAKNLVLAGPSSGSNAAPSFRTLVAADIPDLSKVYLPIQYTAPDFSSATITSGVYPVASITNPVTNVKEYGGLIQFGSYTNEVNHYAAQLLISSASGAEKAVHAYIRRMTSTPAWSNNWSTLLDDKNTTAPSTVPSLSWGSESTVFTLNGTTVKIKAMAKPTYAFTDLTSHPTTLSGYGITDAVTKSTGVTAVAWDSTNKKLTRTINGTTADVVTAATLRTDLGLSSALRFIGKTTTTMSEDFTGTPAGISGYSTPIVGDVVLDSNSDSEYVCISVSGTTYTWERLGRDSSWALDSAVIKKTAFTKAYQILYSSAKDTPAVLDANTTSTRKFLRMTGTGSAGAAPAWDTVTKTDVGLSNVTNHAQVNALAWDTADKKITKTINTTTTDVLQFVAGQNIQLSASSGQLTMSAGIEILDWT